MRASIDRLARGDLSARVEGGGAEELVALADTLNRMADRLSEQIRSAREERETRDLILSSMTEGVLLAGGDGSVTFANPPMERHLGGHPGHEADIYPLEIRDAVATAREELRPAPVEAHLDRPDRWLRGSAVPVGTDGSVLLVLRDVTEAHRVDEIRRDFVANASHELKTPAAAIQAAAETIRTAVSEDPAVARRFAGQLESEAVRLSRIVADLLDLSRLETGSELGDAIDLPRLVREETARFEGRAAELGLRLLVTTDRPVDVRGSARDLGLLVRNLIDNAVRYTRPGGEIEVSVGREDARAVIRVRDTGIGIPTRDLHRVFERFYRVDRARSRETGGTGLGLSIVKHVAENHGGSVDVRSQLGVGSTFEVRLPTAPRSPGST
ncbi:MAG: HAMP domain-containing protein [Actinobacteria bacterium]|nr:HAMP domain-containing protein [Actinomycetota bacterium]